MASHHSAPGSRDPSRRFAQAVLLVTGVFFAAFFAWPIFQVIRGGFVDADGHFTVRYVGAVAANPLYLAGAGNALAVAAATTLVALLLATPLAWLTERFAFPGRALLGSMLLVPMILPPFVGAIGLRQLLGQYGAINAVLHHLGLLAPGHTIDWLAASQFWGVVLAEAFSLYPIVYLNAAAALSSVDPAMEEAAANLGCTGLRRFRRVVLPLIRPGLFAGGTIVFIWSFTELGTPLVFDYTRITSVQIYEGLKDIGGNPLPFTLVSLMLLASVAIYAVGKGLFGRELPLSAAKASHARVLRVLPGRRPWLLTALFALVALIGMLPHLGVILVAFSRDWYGSVLPAEWTTANLQLALGHSLTVPAITNSLRFASLSTIVDLLLGVAIAYVAVRSKLRLRHAVDAMAMLPLAVPGLVLAFGYLAMTQEGKLFSFFNPTRNPTLLLIIAYSIRRLPYVVRAAAAGFQQTSPTLEEAAQNLGCSPLKSVARITLPLIRANLMAGALLAFAFAMLEVSDSLVLAQKQQFYPITKAILDLFQLLGDGRFIASALGVWAMVFLGLVMAAASVILGRKLGALFRM